MQKTRATSPRRSPTLAALWGAPIGLLGGLIGLGGAEFRLPVLVGAFGYAARRAVALNLAISLITVVSALVIRGGTLSLPPARPAAGRGGDDRRRTSYPDTLKGTSASNHIKGLGGNEGLRSGDLIQGFANHDLLYGNSGGDRMEGGNGNDAIFGGLGQDLLIGGTGNDHVDGGSSGDTIMVKDGYVDHVNCEGGNDNVSNRDSFDVLLNC